MYERAGDKGSNRKCTCDVTEEEERETTENGERVICIKIARSSPATIRRTAEFALLASPEATSELKDI